MDLLMQLSRLLPRKRSGNQFELLNTVRFVLAPLLSLFIMILGNGLLTTLLSLRLNVEGASSLIIGCMTGAYYAGLACGAFRVEKFIVRVGHIRAFSAFASAVAIICLLHGMFISVWFWIILRLLSGFFTAGLFVVIESWMLISGTVKMRGQMLALYMVCLYAGQALGQFFINFSSIEALSLFAISAMFSSLSVIPLAMTKVGQPQIDEPSTLNFKRLYQISASGVIGCFCGGLILGSIYGLFPLFVNQKTGSTADVSLFMALVIIGAMILQYPVGRLSDYIERRKVLIGIAVFAIGVSVFIMLTFNDFWFAGLLTFLLGGLTFTIYPISVSHACDNLDTKDIVSGTQGLLLAYSIGAAAGPFIAPIFMDNFGPSGLFLYFILVNSFLVVFFSWRRVQVTAVAQEEQFISLPQTTPITATLDPRSEEMEISQ